MNLAIIIHSQSGTTLKFGNLIADELKKHGHQVDLFRLETEGNVHPGATAKDFKITNLPDVKNYDALLMGCPVWAFNASPVMVLALKEMTGLKGKKVLPFTTMGFPFTGWGGKQAIARMSKEIAVAGATFLPGTIIPKMFHNYKKMMVEAAEKITSYFSK